MESGVGIAVFVRCFVNKKSMEADIVDRLGNGFSRAPFASVVVKTLNIYTISFAMMIVILLISTAVNPGCMHGSFYLGLCSFRRTLLFSLFTHEKGNNLGNLRLFLQFYQIFGINVMDLVLGFDNI